MGRARLRKGITAYTGSLTGPGLLCKECLLFFMTSQKGQSVIPFSSRGNKGPDWQRDMPEVTQLVGEWDSHPGLLGSRERTQLRGS